MCPEWDYDWISHPGIVGWKPVAFAYKALLYTYKIVMPHINPPSMEEDQGGVGRMNDIYESRFSGVYVQTPGVRR